MARRRATAHDRRQEDNMERLDEARTTAAMQPEPSARAWGVHEGSEAAGVLSPKRDQKKGSLMRSHGEMIPLDPGCHCDVHKIVPCQPRAQAIILKKGQVNEV